MAISSVSLSGLDVSGIVSTAVQAKTTSMNSNIQKKINEYNTNLSGLGQLSSYMSSFNDTITSLQNKDNYSVQKSLTQNSDKNDTYGIDVKTTKDVSDEDLDIKVKQLHENAKISHKFSRDFSNHFRSGTINFDLGDNKSFSITVNADDTLEAIRRNINENNPFGLTASLVNSSSGYVLTLNHGEDFDMSFEGDIAEDFAQAEQTKTPAKKAVIEVNGNEIESDTNDFNQISGLEIHANFVSESHVQVRKDDKSLDKDISEFVSKFNSMISSIDSLGKRNTYTDGVSNNDGGALAGNSALRRMKDDLKNTIGNDYMDLGLEFDKNGKLVYKESKGNELSFSERKEKLEELLDKMKIKVDDYLGSDSFISKEKERLNNDISDANDRLSRNNVYIQKYQDAITKQYTKLDSMIQTANTQIQMINNLFNQEV